ncbi:beta strand repeat-containing protein [Polyangium sorediatum]|uniref:SBBP repeat-containing protein n=1 Tax=Polyangium sorediatum TaxID=889274 RepID=A0ABT6P923_9BACT|nr:SBBP repeat-containing protein [Polyangium sorediatum]MDI1436655.1 SBBP repeat-containing protein [Polyangium sorediatum]
MRKTNQHLRRHTSAGALSAVLFALPMSATPGCSDSTEAKMAPGSGKLPISFITNQGQTDRAVQFQARALGGMAFFTAEGPTLSLPRSQGAVMRHEHDTGGAESDEGAESAERFRTVKIKFLDAKPSAHVTTGERLPGVANFLIGDDPSAWRTNIPTYAGLVYEDLYPNIRVRYEGVDANLKSTVEVAPFANPALVRWTYEGATEQRIDDETGNLIVVVGTAERDGESGEDTLIETAPIAWQNIDGENMLVEVRFRLEANGAVHYELGDYDRSKPLIIDPALIYNTYLGSATTTNGRALALDTSGRTYITGDTTSSTLFPAPNGKDTTYNGGNDVFVARLDANGSNLEYSTYLGGAGNDIAYDIAVDSASQAWVVGSTTGTWPTKSAAQGFRAGTAEGFVAKLNATGTDFVFSSYHGGLTAGNGDDFVYGVALDTSGNGYVTGSTTSTNFHTTADAPFKVASGLSDAFLTKWSPAGARVFGTYLGGSGNDVGRGIATTSWGYVVVTGETASTNFGPVLSSGGADTSHNGGIDAFLVSFYGSSLEGATYFGGPQDDVGRGVVVDSQSGYAYVVGDTTSSAFSTPFNSTSQFGTIGGKDAFVVKTDYSGWSRYWLARLAGTQDDIARGVTVDASSNIFVTGTTSSTAFLGGAASAYSSPGRAGADIFVTKLLNGAPTLSFNALLGGSGADDGYDIAVDANGIYVGGTTTSINFPVVAAPGFSIYDGAFAGGTSAVVSKLALNGWSLQYSTFVDGQAAEEANAVATVGKDVYIAGNTTSSGFSTTAGGVYAGGYADSFVTKLDSMSNTMLYSTFIGGAGADYATGISVDSTGRATVVGHSTSTNFPAGNPPAVVGPLGNNDAFLARLNSAGNGFTTSFRFGGASSDIANDVVVDSSGQAFVSGTTFSVDFPVTAGVLQGTKDASSDAFVTRIDLTGAVPVFVYSTFLGGNSNDTALGVATDGIGHAFVVGGTYSINFPTTQDVIQTAYAGNSDAFVAMLKPTGAALVYSTFLGAARYDIARDIAVDNMGNANIVGETQSDDLLVDWPALAGLRNGNTDGLFVKLSPDGKSIPFWTYFGGTNNDYLYGVVVNPSTGVATFAGYTDSSNLSTVAPVSQGTNLKGGFDAVIARIDDTNGWPDFTFVSYLGGSFNDYCRDVALIGDDAVVVGATNSSNFASGAAVSGYDNSFNGESDAFMTRIDL